MARLLRPLDRRGARARRPHPFPDPPRALEEKRVLDGLDRPATPRTLFADDIRDLARDLARRGTSASRSGCFGDHENARYGAAEVYGSGSPVHWPGALDAALAAMNGNNIFRSSERSCSRGIEQCRVFAPRSAPAERRPWTDGAGDFACCGAGLLPSGDLPRHGVVAAEPRATGALPGQSAGGAAGCVLRARFPDARLGNRARLLEQERPRLSRCQWLHGQRNAASSSRFSGDPAPYIRPTVLGVEPWRAQRASSGGASSPTRRGAQHASACSPTSARTKPPHIVVSDGYVEPLSPAQVAATAGTRLHVIVARSGNAGACAPDFPLHDSRGAHRRGAVKKMPLSAQRIRQDAAIVCERCGRDLVAPLPPAPTAAVRCRDCQSPY